jgi:N utilization substance protein A
MKSEFMLAFNEICQSRGLPRDIVLEALENALVSAYRRDTNSSANQEITVNIDQHDGNPTIYAEKEVVDSIIDDRTEVTIENARLAGYADVEMGAIVMMDSTPPNFGRIAAQTAKQVILQRVREAERDQLFEDFSAREGEIVNGTVQSVSGQHITIGLGRTEALLPKSQQVKSERYRAHDKIRVYVLEVRRTNRGPQIIVSRSHRNLLRRLLELEVPEIYNGQVDIKSIAREAGARSKVAVSALQPGVDPVGACVGMRGVRIQSIVRELNDEKIDVIEYNSDQKTFIAKALSPARVAQVFLEDSLEEGKTATVIVPDDQLSLAIGREGQNARLAAKLTGWRIDIKSLTEATRDSLGLVDHPNAEKRLTKDAEGIKQLNLILAKKEAGRPITAEDYNAMSRFVLGVEGKIISMRATEYERVKAIQNAARNQVPEFAWKVAATQLDLPENIDNLLEKYEMESLGDILYNIALGEDTIMALEGFSDKYLETLKDTVTSYVANYKVEFKDEIAKAAEAKVEVVETPEPEAELEPVTTEPVAEVEEVEEEAEVELVEPEEEEDEALEPISALDDLAKPLVTPVKPKVVEQKAKPKPKIVVVKEPEPRAAQDDDDKKPRRGKQLVFDEKAGKVVVRRKRKKSRSNDWEDFGDEFDF